MDALAGLMSFCEWLFRVSWQASVLALLVFFVGRLARGWIPAQWRHALWLLVVIRLLAPSLPESPTSVFNAAPIHFLETPVAQPSPERHDTRRAGPDLVVPVFDELLVTGESGVPRRSAETIVIRAGSESQAGWSWQGVAAVIWLIGICCLSARLALAFFKARTTFAGGREIVDPRILQALDDCKARFGIRRRIPVVETGQLATPAVFGTFRPKLLLPIGLAESLSAREMKFIFAHELAHVKRWDVALSWLVSVLQILHWFNPFLWLAFYRMRVDRELACDELALSVLDSDSRKEYGHTILRLLSDSKGSASAPAMVGILEDTKSLAERIRMVAAFRPGKRWSFGAIGLAIGLSAVALTDARTGAGGSLASEADILEPADGANIAGPSNTIDQEAPKAKGVEEVKQGITVSGQVVDEEGQPVQGVDVRLGQSLNHLDLRATVTDRDGRFLFEDVKSGDTLLTTVREGFAPDMRPVQIRRSDLEEQIELELGTTLRARVVDPEGAPVEGAYVHLQNWRGRQVIEWHGRTDKEGRFSWSSAPADGLRLVIQKPGYKKSGLWVAKADESERLIQLRPNTLTRGVVVDAQSKEPVPSFTVIPGTILEAERADDVHSWDRSGSMTGETGEFALTITDDSTHLRVEAVGYSPAIVFITSDEPLRIELERARMLSGKILGPDGKPADGATIVVCGPNLRARAYMREGKQFALHLLASEYSTASGADGRFEQQLEDGCRAMVVAHKEGYAEIPIAGNELDVEVRLQPWGRVEGVLRIGNSVGHHEEVWIVDQHWRYESRPCAQVMLRARTDNVGRFAFEGVPPGQYRIGYVVRSQAASNQVVPLKVQTPLAVQPDETTEVVIGGEGRRVIGKAVFSDPSEKINWLNQSIFLRTAVPAAPIPPEFMAFDSREAYDEAWVAYKEKALAFWTSDRGRDAQRNFAKHPLVFHEDGSFQIEDVAPGVYDLEISIQPPGASHVFHGIGAIGEFKRQVLIGDPNWHLPFDLGVLIVEPTESDPR